MTSTASNMPTEVRAIASPRRPSGSSHPEMTHRNAFAAARTAVAAHSPRPETYSYSNPRQVSASRHSHLVDVPHRDFEQSNVSQTPSRSNLLRDGYFGEAGTSHAEGPRNTRRTSSRLEQSRYPVDGHMPNSTMTNGTNATHSNRPPSSANNAPRRRTTVPAQTGQWALGKTIGQGSMGKVKLARNMETGEQVAIKIVPRQSQDEHRNQQDRDRAEHSKEVRTAREAAIVTLVNHPYICGMRDVVRTHHHWYMLFEYVNGGQMLDYIISHGRLKEKQARKFGRQIASALDYCHRNSIVHRDLKIENILISKEANIKIIDFGLSNLFSPKSVLKTFCGSLYFAAPELLQAKAYTGPEVDIWSFGIVLYVLVCGKVPFDDQSMPQLHAKIKKGIVEYPPWLSHECKHVISRMLVTDPRQRATLHEIMNHPWMTKGFNGPPENFLPYREPLQLPLDPLVIEKMTGFDFGSAEYITSQLESIITSDDYQQATYSATHRPASHAETAHKKTGMFEFYQRRRSTVHRDTLTPPSVDSLPLGEDPLNAFNPLVSIYYLAREKLGREKHESNPGGLAMPQSPGEKPLQMPGLAPAPEAVDTSGKGLEMAIAEVTGNHDRSKVGRDEDTDSVETRTKAGPTSPTPPINPSTPENTPVKKERVGAGLLRRLSTRRGRNPDRDKSDPPPPTPPILAVSEPDPEPLSTALEKRKSVRQATRDRATPPSAYEKYANNPDLLAPPTPSEPAGSRKYLGLGRSTSVNSAELKKKFTRRDKSGTSIATVAVSESETPTRGVTKSDTRREASEVPPQRLATTRTKSLGHARRESIQERRFNRELAKESEVPEETDVDLVDDSTIEHKTDEGVETMKPVYLKGLFSVSTTSNKPLAFIRSDIIRVLRQLDVDFREIKGGFSCRYVPSHENSPPPEVKSPPTTHRRRISFAGLRGREHERSERDDQNEQQPPRTPATPRSAGIHSQLDNYTNSDDSDEEAARRNARTPRAPGETTTHVHSDMNKSVVLKFEIFVVKVPLLSLHGLQFKKVEGNTWHYRHMAATVLAELRL